MHTRKLLPSIRQFAIYSIDVVAQEVVILFADKFYLLFFIILFLCKKTVLPETLTARPGTRSRSLGACSRSTAPRGQH